MRHILSLSLLSFLALSCSDSDDDRIRTGPVQTATVEKFVQFEDYDASFSSDSTKSLFLSRRTEGTPFAYFYNAAAEPKLVRVDDVLQLDIKDSSENFAALNNSGSLLAVNRLNTAASTTQIIVAEPNGASRAVIDVPAGTTISELKFARGSDNFLVYGTRTAGTKSLKVVKVDLVAGTSITLTEVEVFGNQENAQFILNGSTLSLLSFVTSTDPSTLARTASVQNYDEAQGVWTAGATSATVKAASVDRDFELNQAGLFSAERLTTSKLRSRLGSSPTAGTDVAAEKVLVSDSLIQNNVFASALSYDFAQANYTGNEPLTLSSLSGTLDGQYLLAAGLDSFSCTASVYQLPVFKLIRQSDMKTLTLTVARNAGSAAWTDLVTTPCAVYDTANTREIDATISQGDLIGLDNGFFSVAFYSQARIDSEIRLARFKVDFDAGTVSEVTISDISANSR